MVIVTARVKLQSGKSEEFIEAARVMQTHVKNDPGALQYSLCRAADDPDSFMFYERYEDEEAFAYHMSTEHCKTLTGTIDPLMAEPVQVNMWVEVF